MDISLNELSQRGQQIYFAGLKDKLEKTNLDDYVVIEVESKKYFVDKDQVTAVKKALKKFPGKLFFIAKIGNLRESPMNIKTNENYAWVL